MPIDDVTSALVRALARYLGLHPQASDTAQGIARWWLADQAPVREAALLRALEWLERQRLVERVSAPDGRVRFRRSDAADGADWPTRAARALAGLPPP
ncbi:MAG: hypothetical protein KF788_17940 [Piscinibacter sp.]|nr:hypothetical protein [Piscinibacter sp.]